MESMLPPDTRKASLGRPNTVMLFSFFQSGWEMTPTRYPWDSKTLLIMACPKEG
jgi:hypothetical protein